MPQIIVAMRWSGERHSPLVVTALLLGCSSVHTEAAAHFDTAAKLVTAGEWNSSLAEFERGCALGDADETRKACREKAKRLYAGHAGAAAPAGTSPAASAAATNAAAASSAGGFVAGAPQPNAYAVVIGIEHYEGLPAPTGAKRDAERFAEMAKQTLGVAEGHLKVALEERATKGAIERDVEWARTNVPKGGRIYFYFSGHGAPQPSSGTSYLLPADGDPKFLKQSGLLVSEVVAQLANSPAKEVLVVLDSCFSGAGGRSVLPAGARPIVRVVEIVPKADVAVLTAGTGSEISGPSSDGKSGLFSSYLLQAIGRGAADADGDGQVTLQETADWVKPRVARDAQKDGRDQNPALVVGAGLGAPSSFLIAWGLPAK